MQKKGKGNKNKKRGEKRVQEGPALIRLNRYIALSGICSRREADERISRGEVTVDGKKVTSLGTKVPMNADVRVRGRKISPEKKVYILLNKPKDCITTAKDPEGRKTVFDLIRLPDNTRIFPVGRLDRNTTGVLLLTNDGALAQKLTHPRYAQKKIYQVTLDRDLTRTDMEKLVSGIELEEGKIAADAVSYVHEEDKKIIGMEIHSGQNRVVRRLFEKLGYRVKQLDRVSFAGLTKKALPRGRWRHLTEKEIVMLRRHLF
jgi:23S rRNA pseudouridine2605 synthase